MQMDELLVYEFRGGKKFNETNLLQCYVDWFVQNDPRNRFMAAGCSRRPLVSHVVFGIGQQTTNWYVLYSSFIITITNSAQLLGQYSQFGIGQLTFLKLASKPTIFVTHTHKIELVFSIYGLCRAYSL